MNFIKSIFGILIMLFLIGCASIAWNQTEKGNTIELYEKYINSYPDSEYVKIAKERINEINEEERTAKAKLSTYKIGITSYNDYKRDFSNALNQKPIFFILPNSKCYNDMKGRGFSISGVLNITNPTKIDIINLGPSLRYRSSFINKIINGSILCKNPIIIHGKKIAELEFIMKVENDVPVSDLLLSSLTIE